MRGLAAEARSPGRLADRLRPGLAWVLVGINPGLRSAALGHHFAGPSNRFWSLLHESGWTPRRLRPEEDRLLPSYGLGLTNLVARPTRSVGELTAEDFARGRRDLERRLERYRPRGVAFVGLLAAREALREKLGGRARRVRCGPLPRVRYAGASVFVLPNPSGRNAHYSYAEMLSLWRRLRRASKEGRRG